MKRRYYDEKKMGSIRQSFDEKIFQWPDVHAKRMFGCPCYQVNGRLFTFLVTDGVVVTQLDQTDRELLSRQHHGTSFHAGRRAVQSWVKLPVEKIEDLNQIMPLVRKSYEYAIQKAQ